MPGRSLSRSPMHRPELGREGVMRACLELLEVHHIWHRRMNSGAAKIEGKNGKTRMFRANAKGTGDILMTPLLQPRVVPIQNVDADYIAHLQLMMPRVPLIVWVECKSSTGKQRPGQKEFEAEVKAAGHEYIVVNDVQQLIDWLRYRGVIRAAAKFQMKIKDVQ